jgi:hypothetical protein
MPILLWVVFPFAIWSACMGPALSTTKTNDMPREFGG